MKSTTVKPKTLAFSIAAAVAMTATGASTAQAQQRQLEEIVVTAERRAVTEQTTSISMEVFTGEDISAQQIRELEDLQNNMPGIQIQNNGLGNEIQIRGVGSSVFSPNVQMGVQVVNDGVAHGEPMGLNGAFFDVGTVEVLRGPQGTFVGQSAAGGAILINSAQPNFDGINGYMEGTIGNYARNQLQGALNLPITDTFAGRIAFNTHRRDSFYRNEGAMTVFSGEGLAHPGSLDDRQIRLSLLWQPSQNFNATLKIEQNNVNHEGIELQPKLKPTTGFLDDDGDPTTAPIEVTTYSRYREYNPRDPYTIHQSGVEKDSQTNDQVTLNVDYQLANGMTLSGLYGFNDLSVQNVSDGDSSRVATPQDNFELGPNNVSHTYELTLASPDNPTNWIVGAKYSERDTPFRTYGGATPNDNCGWQSNGTHVECGPLANPTSITSFSGRAFVYQTGIFGQYNWQFSPEWQLQIGGRWNIDDSDYRETLVVSGPVGTAHPAFGAYQPGTCPGVNMFGGRFSNINRVTEPDGWGCIIGFDTLTRLKDSPVDTEVPTYKVGVNWTPVDNSYFYAFYARGYKAAAVSQSGTFFVEPELINDYELGWKGDLFDGAFSGNIGLYFMDYEDMQTEVFIAGSTGSDEAVSNVGNAEMYGLEGSFQAFIGNFGISGTLAWQESEIEQIRTLNPNGLPSFVEFDSGDNDFLPQCGLPGGPNNPATGFQVDGVTPNGNCFDYDPYYLNLAGQPQQRAPELSYTLGLDYQFILPAGTFTPSIEFSHTDENYNGFIQTDYYLNDERDLVNVNLVYEWEDWTVDAFVQNLTDETYIRTASGGSVGYGDPQTYGVRLRMNF